MNQPLIRVQVITAADLGVQFKALDEEYTQRTLRALDAAGLIVQNAARRSIVDGPKSGRLYKRGSVVHRASAPGQPPANDTGRLLGTIVYRVLGLQLAVEITAGTIYAKFLEFGTRKMEPRPFMNPALTNNLDKVRAVMRAVLSTPVRRINARRR